MMMTYSERIARVSTALADPTRREILEHVLSSGSPLSVRDVAGHFSLHANAARMHLNKLVEGGLLQVMRRRGDRGGRPAKLYGASRVEQELSLPARRYKLLAEVLVTGISGSPMAIIHDLGDEDFRRGREEAMGRSSPLAYLPEEAGLRDMAAVWVDDIAHRGHGALASVTLGGQIMVTFLTCPFGDCSRNHPGLVCEIHRRMEEGVLSLRGAISLEAAGDTGVCGFILRDDTGVSKRHIHSDRKDG